METKKGSCHCGQTEIEVEVDLGQGGMTCNCSICSRSGWVLTFVSAEQMKITKQGPQTDYRFGKESIRHPFCSVCGVRVYSEGKNEDGSAAYSVNLRCLEEVDVTKLRVQEYDGAAI